MIVIEHEPKLRFSQFKLTWHKKKLSDLMIEPKARNLKLLYNKNDVLSVSGEYGIVNQVKHLGRSYA